MEGEIEDRERRILQAVAGEKRSVQVTAKVVGIIKRNWRTYVLSFLIPFPLARLSVHASLVLAYC